jgi:hypothetical protein
LVGLIGLDGHFMGLTVLQYLSQFTHTLLITSVEMLALGLLTCTQCSDVSVPYTVYPTCNRGMKCRGRIPTVTCVVTMASCRDVTIVKLTIGND